MHKGISADFSHLGAINNLNVDLFIFILFDSSQIWGMSSASFLDIHLENIMVPKRKYGALTFTVDQAMLYWYFACLCLLGCSQVKGSLLVMMLKHLFDRKKTDWGTFMMAIIFAGFK